MPWGRNRIPVGAVVPTGFQGYARVLHPAESPRGTPVTWKEVAAWAGHVYHAEMQWEAISNPKRQTDEPAPWHHEPRIGWCPDPIRTALSEILRNWTETPEHCFACVWEGYGGITEHFPKARKLDHPHRGYLLVAAPLLAISEGLLKGAGGRGIGPNIWWPEDRTWCVASEIDYRWTYVGGRSDCIEEILYDSRIEALMTSPSHGGGMSSDEVNVHT
jgi:hypothetical protein